MQPFKRKGVTKYNTLSADEEFAQLFGLYLTLMVPKVFESLVITDQHEMQTFVNPDGSETKKTVNIGLLGFRRASLWVKLLSRMLTFNAWIMSPEHAKHDLQLRQT